MTTPMPTRSRPHRSRAVPISHFRSACETARLTLLSLDRGLKDELERWKPGGAENPGRDAYGWLAYYRRLHREIAARQGRPGSRAAAPAPNDVELATRLNAAMLEQPVPVTLELPDETGVRPTVTVRPLSYDSLAFLDALDRQLARLAREADRLAESDVPADAAAFMRARQEICWLQRVFCWVLTSDAAPRLPFDPVTTPDPSAPEWTERLTVVDVVRVLAAHHAVHARTLSLLNGLLRPGEDDSDRRPGSWQTFFSGLEAESNEPAKHFMRDRALPALLASRVLAADARRQAMDDAKRRADAGA